MLTSEQLATLKADILADQVLNAFPNTLDGAFEIAIAYNTAVSPTFYVWASQVTTSELMQNGFDWSRVDNLTVGKSRIWEYMTQAGIIDPSKANVRAGFNACFSAAGDANTRQAIFNHCQRAATRGEKLFSTGAGTATTNTGTGPATTVLLVPITMNDVYAARNLP